MQKKSNFGFTLIEILIVLVIIGVMSSVVVLNAKAPSYTKFMSLAQKISSTLEVLGDQAVYTDSVIVCDLRDGFSCQSYKNGEWNELKLSKILSWSWPSNIEILQLYVNGLKLNVEWKIQFLPTGDASQISLQITDGKYVTWIDGDTNGSFKVNN